jgi:poly(hydroxyalkanoate) granule-associated protein
MGKKKKREENELKASVQKIWLAGLGALSAAEEGGNKLFQVLVDRGQEFDKGPVTKAKKKVESAVKKVRDQAGKTFENLDSSIEGKIASALKKMGVPTQDEIAKLARRVDRLEAMLESKKPTIKKTAKKAASRTTKKKVT